jgi:hypothetical protein
MDSKVFERAMFKAESKPRKADSGIMQGFDDEEPKDIEENDDEMMEEVSRRSPSSPEILMNNLRGDMRSVDARYQELAEMVGEDVAMETPPEVLAMLQSQFTAQQAPAGISGLPAGGAPMAPPPPPQMGGGMPPAPPQMPQGPMPTDQGPAPQGFAYGGMVDSAPGYGPMSMMAPPMYQGAMAPQGYAKGGIASLPQSGANYNQGVSYSGQLEPGANYIQGAGRNGDTMVAHMTPQQHQVLSMMGGGSTTNPKTGLPEHYMGAGMATNLMQRIQPYAQAANQMIGSRMAPVLTPPSIQQSRTTLGTFGPKTVEGMELTYPTLTQRIGMATEPVRNYIANMPASQKAIGALSTIPGGAAVINAMGGGERVEAMPSTDVPAVISTDSSGNRIYSAPPKAEVPKEPETKGKAAPSKVVADTTPSAAPKTVEELITRQTKAEKTNRLEDYMKENLPIFEKYMGGDKEASQIQALLLLADAGLEYATKPARTGMIALANAFKRMPAGLSQLAAQEEARRTQIRGAALTSGLQTIAAEDKATAAIQRELIKKAVSAGEVVPTDRGAGLTSYVDKQGQPKGMQIDPQIANSFLNSRFTPQVQKDKEGNLVGFDTPYARVSPASQTLNLDKTTRERLANEVSRQESALAAIDDVIKEYSGAFGPKAFFSNLKNNVLVPVSPLDPNVMTEQQRTKINMAINNATKAIARTGDTGNIAVAEQTAAASILGDKPGTFFSDSQGALKRMMTVRTSLANQRLNTAAQLGWINQDVQLEVPNLGTPADPIPQEKLTYLKSLKQVNPNAQVYININGKSTPVLLSTLKD